MTKSPSIGRVHEIHRYPVKSMGGERLQAVEIVESGLVGDRAYALVDAATGKIASAKEPGKWGRLLDYRAAFVRAPGTARVGDGLAAVSVILPDGRSITSDQNDAAARLSAAIGRPVALASRAPDRPSIEVYWPDVEGLFRGHRNETTVETITPGRFLDYSPVHLLTRASLARLQKLCPAGRIDVRRFRPNVLVDLDDVVASFVESGWIGRVLVIGDDVRLSLAEPCPRCVMITAAQHDLPRDPELLRTLAKENSAGFGLYCRVAATGTIRVGDPIRLE